MRRAWLIAVTAGLVAAGTPAWAAGYWAGIAEDVIGEVDRAEAFAKAGQTDDAKEAVINSYFALFEDKKMETAERSALGAKHIAEVEAQFNDLRKAAGKPGASDLHLLAESLRRTLRADGRALDDAKIAADGIGVGK